jgi:hypothetical protein
MKIVSVPTIEVDGQPIQQGLFFREDQATFQVYSHRNPSIVTLRFLTRTVSVDAAILQAAIRDVVAKSAS